MNFTSSYDRLPKWQKRILNESIEIATDFVKQKYPWFYFSFNEITLQPSTTCRFAKYTHRRRRIRLDMKRQNVYLYDMPSIQKIQKYTPNIICKNYLISYASQLIHELTHHVQASKGWARSEVETTENELEFLRERKII